MSLVSGEKSNFQFILRLLNTNVRAFHTESRRARNSCDAGKPWEKMGQDGEELDGMTGHVLTMNPYRLMASRRSCTP